jgi:hypothetical protein
MPLRCILIGLRLQWGSAAAISPRMEYPARWQTLILRQCFSGQIGSR